MSSVIGSPMNCETSESGRAEADGGEITRHGRVAAGEGPQAAHVHVALYGRGAGRHCVRAADAHVDARGAQRATVLRERCGPETLVESGDDRSRGQEATAQPVAAR